MPGQVGQASAGSLLVAHEDGRERLTGGGFESSFIAGVHVYELDQRPHHAADPGQAAGPGTGPGLV
jgi:hypothetical protein